MMPSPIFAIRTIIVWSTLAVLLTASGSAAQPATQLLSGPMLGHATSTSATVWFETDRPADDHQYGYHRGEVRVAHRLTPADLSVADEGDAAANADFRPLFDGESLDGWVVENTDAGNFTVQDGVLRVDGSGGWLRSENMYADFDLRVEFRFLTDDADSGVFVRVGDTESTFARGWPAGSYQVQTRDISTNRSERPLLLGDVYRHRMPDGETDFDAEAVFDVVRETGAWQEFLITVSGDSLLVDLNGTPITRAFGIANRSGYIGLQGETDTVEFRAIEIRERGAEKPANE